MNIAPFFQDTQLCHKKIAVISSDISFTKSIKIFFKNKNYNYLIVSFNSFREKIKLFSPDIIFIDLDFFEKKDPSFSDKLNLLKEFKDFLIAFFYSSLDETDMLIAFELGVFDCFNKDENLEIIFSKINNFFLWLEKKDSSNKDKKVTFGPFIVDFSSLTIKKNNKNFSLTFSEFKILQKLIMANGEVISREDLLKEIDPTQENILERNIDVHIAALRKKLGPNFHWLVTVRGIGYRFNR